MEEMPAFVIVVFAIHALAGGLAFINFALRWSKKVQPSYDKVRVDRICDHLLSLAELANDRMKKPEAVAWASSVSEYIATALSGRHSQRFVEITAPLHEKNVSGLPKLVQTAAAAVRGIAHAVTPIDIRPLLESVGASVPEQTLNIETNAGLVLSLVQCPQLDGIESGSPETVRYLYRVSVTNSGTDVIHGVNVTIGKVRLETTTEPFEQRVLLENLEKIRLCSLRKKGDRPPYSTRCSVQTGLAIEFDAVRESEAHHGFRDNDHFEIPLTIIDRPPVFKFPMSQTYLITLVASSDSASATIQIRVSKDHDGRVGCSEVLSG
jgi:hypothetical protein